MCVMNYVRAANVMNYVRVELYSQERRYTVVRTFVVSAAVCLRVYVYE